MVTYKIFQQSPQLSESLNAITLAVKEIICPLIQDMKKADDPLRIFQGMEPMIPETLRSKHQYTLFTS